jgi:hypothetical protein
MLRERLHSWLLLPTLLLCGCGSAQELAPTTPLGESARSVLYTPPAPASGNILDNPQYLSFGFSVRAGAQVKLEVTHLGSSPYLDTGLFVYGPRQADGGYGTAALAQDDDAGYGKLSKVSALALAQGGDYLVVVSTGTGAGKQLRLQLDCLNGACAPQVAPALYATCDLGVATRIEECVGDTVEEYGMSQADARDLCTGPDDAHAFYREACNSGGTAPAWCQGGEVQFTQRMWPGCQDGSQHTRTSAR